MPKESIHLIYPCLIVHIDYWLICSYVEVTVIIASSFLPSSSLGSALRPRLVRVCGETELDFIKIFHQQQQITTGSSQESAVLSTQRRGWRSGENISLECFLIVGMNKLMDIKSTSWLKCSIYRCFLTWHLHCVDQWRRLDCVMQLMWSSFEVCLHVWGNECQVPGKLHFHLELKFTLFLLQTRLDGFWSLTYVYAAHHVKHIPQKKKY